VLEDALLHPEKHEDLVVRVWGFNARFIDLDEGLKRHVMSRIL
jgi:formate C-acetyltransferase